MRVRTGRFTELPGRSRVMDFHPQFFDRHETLILQPLIGHTGMGGQSSGHGPRAVSVHARADGGTQKGAEFEQFPNLGAAPSPLFPVAHAHPPPDPTVDLRDVAVLLGNAEVGHPAPDVGRQLVQPVLHGNEPASSGVLLDSATKFLVRLVGPEDAGSLKGEAEKFELIGMNHPTFGFVDRELEFARQKRPDALHDPLPGTLALHQNDEVVGVADEAVPALLKLLVQVVQQDVGQQR